MAPKFNLPTISTGDLIRTEIKAKSKLGLELSTFANSGKLVPHELVMDMVKKRLAFNDCKPGFILDGFPRTVKQAQDLEKFAPLTLVVNIELKEKYLLAKIMGRRVCPACNKNFNIAHISDVAGGVEMPPLLPKHGDSTKCDCGCKLEQRKDDTENIVKERLKVYHDETFPLISFYEKTGVLRNFEVKKGLDDLPKLEAILNKEFKR